MRGSVRTCKSSCAGPRSGSCIPNANRDHSCKYESDDRKPLMSRVLDKSLLVSFALAGSTRNILIRIHDQNTYDAISCSKGSRKMKGLRCSAFLG